MALVYIPYLLSVHETYGVNKHVVGKKLYRGDNVWVANRVNPRERGSRDVFSYNQNNRKLGNQ
jgi:hypothetical protein